MNEKASCYVPYKVFNVYAANVRALLQQSGYESYPIKRVLIYPRLFFQCKIFNFNWFEEAHSAKEYYFKMILLRMLKLFGKKIIFTLHNKHPHEVMGNKWSNNLSKNLCSLSDVIIGMCPDTRDVVEEMDSSAVDKLRIIPHPNYIHNYETTEQLNYRSKFGFDEKDIVFLFLGVVSPYKNLDLLINIFEKIDKENIKLLVAGKPSDDKYGKQLEDRLSHASNIKYDFRRIPDNEISLFYRTCDLVILPYNKSSYLNSGAVYLSFSLKKTVICPMIGSIKMIEDKSFIYTYDYENEGENHRNALKKAIFKAIDDSERNPSTLLEKGENAYDYVKKVHDDQSIAKMYKEIYDELFF